MTPLAGIRIADFTVHNAGPFCTHMFSQLGAEVIKIESAMRLDAFRKPHPVYGRMGPATFDQVASTKLSVRINLKKPEGVDLARRIVALSDVAAESFRPGVMERLGLGYEALKTVKQDIVMLSVSSSGQSGPDSHFAGYAPLFGAWGGLGALTGYADGPPVEIRHVMDHTVGMNAAVALMAALHRRRATGRGGHVDVAARDVAASLIGDQLLYAAAGSETGRSGNAHPRLAPHGVYPAMGEDRWLAISVGDDDQWSALLRLMGREDLVGDDRYAAEADRHARAQELDSIVAEWTARQDATEAAQTLQEAGIAAHVSVTTPELAADPHLREREAIVEVREQDGTPRLAVGAPMRLSKAADIGIHRGTPMLGEDEDHVYGELLGLSREKRRALEDAEVIY